MFRSKHRKMGGFIVYRIISLVLVFIFALSTFSCGGGSSSGPSSFDQGKNNQWLIYSKDGGLAETAKKTISVFFDKDTFTKNTIIKLEDSTVTKSPDNSLVQIGGCKLTYIAATKESSVSYPKQLTKSAIITVKLDPARNPAEKIKVYWANEIRPDSIEEYSTMQIAIDGRTASCSVDHFGYYHIFANPKTADDKPYEYIGPVQKLAAKTSSSAIKLSWNPPTSGDIAGYKVLWIKSLSESVVLTPSIITSTTFSDTQAIPNYQLGLKITYRVVAISKTNTSGWPAEVNVKIPSLPSKFSLFRGEDLFPFVFTEVNSYVYQTTTQKWIFANKDSSDLTLFGSDLVFNKVVKPGSTLILKKPQILSLMSDDKLVCYDSEANSILLIDKELKTSNSIVSSTVLSKSSYGSVKDIYCDATNRIWVLFSGGTDSSVRIYDVAGKQITEFGAPDDKTNALIAPVSMCSRSVGGVYILDKIGVDKWSIKIFNDLGQLIGYLQYIDDTLAPKLAGIPNLKNPTSIAEFTDGRVVVADTGNKRVLVIGTDYRLHFVYWFEDKNTTTFNPESAEKYQVCKLQGGPTNLLIDPIWNNLTLTDEGFGYVCTLKRTDE